MKYNVTISVKETENGSFVFVAKYPSLKGVSGTGDTQFDAMMELEENAKAHIEFMEMDGVTPPEPDTDDQTESARAFQVRLPYQTYLSLQARAEKTKLSMNQIIIAALQRDLTHYDYMGELSRYLSMERKPCRAIQEFLEIESKWDNTGRSSRYDQGRMVPINYLAMESGMHRY